MTEEHQTSQTAAGEDIEQPSDGLQTTLVLKSAGPLPDPAQFTVLLDQLAAGSTET